MGNGIGGRTKQSRTGMALFLVLVQVFILALIIAALGSMALRNLRATSEKSWERQARFAAYAGIQTSLAELDADHRFQSTAPLERQLSEDGYLRYTFEVRNNVDSGDGSSVLAPDNTWIPPGTAWVRSKGFLAEVGSYETSALIALVSRARPVFDHAIFAEERIQIEGSSIVRSYSSALGFTASASQPGSPRTQAHLGSNSVDAGAIQLASSAWVDGNAYSGLGSVPGAVVVGSSHTGSSLQLDEEKQVFRFRTLLPSPTSGLSIPWLNPAATHWVFPWETHSEHTGGNPDIPRERSYSSYLVRTNNPKWGRATNLFSGEYFVDGNLTLQSDFSSFKVKEVGGPTQIPVHANDEFPVIIYVSGNVTLNNVLVNNVGADGNDPVPRRLQIYLLTPGSTFRMTNESVAHAMVAGKEVNVVVEEDSQLYGAVIAGHVRVSDSQVHYDTALTGVPLDGRTAWDILAMKEASVGEATQAVGDTGAAEGPPPSIYTLAQHPERGTRAPGNFAADPGEEGPDTIPRDEIEIDPPGADPPGDPDCTTCGGNGVGGDFMCADAPQCPKHGACDECGYIGTCNPLPCDGCGSYYPGDPYCPGGFAHVT